MRRTRATTSCDVIPAGFHTGSTPDPSASQQHNQNEVGIAYSQLLAADTAAFVDFVHGDKPQRSQQESIIDIGVKHLLGDTVAVSFGGGFGMGQQSPAFRILFSVQKDIQLF